MVKKFLKPRKKGLMGLLGFQQGDLTGYQDGDMIGPPVPPQMMGNQGNRELSDSIDMRQANPQVGGGIGIVRQQATALQDSIDMNTADSARKALQLLKIKRLADQGLGVEVGRIQPPRQDSTAILDRNRDLQEYLKMQAMQRSPGSVMEGLGDNPWSAIR